MQIFGNNNPKLIFAVRDNYSPISTEEGGCKIQRDRTTVSVRLEGDVKVGAKELCVQTFQMDLNLRQLCRDVEFRIWKCWSHFWLQPPTGIGQHPLYGEFTAKVFPHDKTPPPKSLGVSLVTRMRPEIKCPSGNYGVQLFGHASWNQQSSGLEVE